MVIITPEKMGCQYRSATIIQDFVCDPALNHARSQIPEADDRDVVHRVIYEELCLGRIEESSRRAYRDVMQRLVERGAQGIILGCTEISMLVGEQEASVPLFDTTAIHAAAAAELALAAVELANV